MPESAWGAGVEGSRGETLFAWHVNGRPVSVRYRASRWVTVAYAHGHRRLRSDGVGGVLTRPADRRRGYAAMVVATSLEVSRHEGYALGLLFCVPALMAWYRRLGWWMTRDLSVTYQSSMGTQTLDTSALWVGLFRISGDAPVLATVTGIAIEGRVW